MKILLLLTSVFDWIGGIHTCNRALIKATDDLASDFGLEVTVFSLLDDKVPEHGAAAAADLIRTQQAATA